MARIRVLVVDDSLTVRKHLVETLGADPEIEVVGEAADGKAGIELCEKLRPDVVTLDMMMPVMTGLTATEYIMAYVPTPILIISASTNRGEVFRTYDALSAGAVDALDKPDADAMTDRWEREMIARVKLVAKIKVITHPRARLGGERTRAAGASVAEAMAKPAQEIDCVAIGASTGGPGAVLEILRSLPADFPAPILLVIHIGKPFGLAMAEWLDGLSPLRVKVAADGEPLPGYGQPGVIMAPHEQHLTIDRGRLRLDSGPERHCCRPSVDVLFESVAREIGPGAVGCLLTGMGRDGAQGLLAMRRQGAITIAQDETTSVIFGMPGEAVRLGAARHVLPIQEVAPTLRSLVGDAATGGQRS